MGPWPCDRGGERLMAHNAKKQDLSIFHSMGASRHFDFLLREQNFKVCYDIFQMFMASRF